MNNLRKKTPKNATGILSGSTGNFYQSLFEDSKSIMMVIDPLTASIADVNKAAIEFYGYTKESFLSMKVSDVNTSTPEEISIALKTAVSNKQNYYNFQHKLSSGELKAVEVYTNPIELNGKEYLFSIIHDVSEKKEIEEKLIKSEEKYRQIFESSMDGIILAIPGGEVLNANPSATNILGWTQDEIKTLGREGIFDLTDPNNRQAFEEMKLTGEFFGQVKYSRKDGSSFPAEISSKIFTLKDGSKRTCIIFRDLTEKKKNQELLSDAFEFNEKIFNSSFVGKAVYNSTGQCISANDKFMELVGASKELILSQNFKELESWKKYGLLQAAEEILETGKHLQKDIYIETTFGKKIWIELNAIRFYSKSEPHLLLMIHDISERINTVRILKTSEEKFSKIFHSNPAAIIISSMDDGVFYDINETTEKITGYSKSEVIGRSIYDLGIWVDEGERNNIIKKLNEGEVIRDLEIKIYKKDRQILTGSFSIDIIEMDSKKMLLTSMVDITDRKNAEEEIARGKKFFETLFESLPGNAFVIDESFNYVQWNTKAEQSIGLKNLKERGVFRKGNQFDPKDYLKVKNALQKVFDEGFSSVEYTVKYDEGKETNKLATASLFEWGGKRYAVGLSIDITEKKKTEEALHKSEVIFREFFNKDTNYCYIISKEGMILDINPAALKTLGYNRTEVVGKPLVSTIYSPSSQILAKELFKGWLKTGKIDNAEIKIVTKSGEEREVLLNVSAVYDLSGNILHSVSVQTDITEFKRIQAQQQILLEQKQLALDAARLGWWYYDPATQIVNWDERYEKISGVTRSHARAEEIFIRIVPEDLPLVKASLAAAQNPDNPKPYIAEYRIVHEDGSIHWVEAYGLSVFEGSGKERHSVSMIGTVQDITERKEAENAIRESEYKLQCIFDSAPVGMGVISNRNMITVNGAFCEITGFKAEELIQKNTKMLYPDSEYYNLSGKQLEILFNENKPVKYESKLKRKDGSLIDVIITLAIFGPITPERLSIFSIFDITEMKKAENILAESQTHLNTIINSTEDFIWSADPDKFGLIKFNEALHKNFLRNGLEIHEGMTPFEMLLPPDHANFWVDCYKKTLDKGFFSTEYKVFNETKILFLLFNVLKKENKIFGISVFGRDITEIRRGEEYIRELAEDLQKAQKVSHVGSWKWFIQTNKLEWSDEMYQIFGINKERFSGNLADILIKSIYPSDLDAVNESNLSVIRNGKPIPLEYRIVLPDKSIRTVWAEAGELIYDNDKQPYLLTGIVQDITEQKKIGAELRESNERYGKLVATIPDVIVRADINGNITFVSEAIIQNWGFKDKQKFIDKNVFGFVAERDRLRAQTNMARVFTEHVGLQEYTLLIDDREIETEIHADALHDYERKPSGLVFVIRDITKRKRVEKELEEYRLHLEDLVKMRTQAYEEVNKKLEQEIIKVKEAEELVRHALEKEKDLSELKSKFISITSHEFRTPLTTLLSSVEILEMAGKNYDDNKRNAHYQKIKNNIEFLVKMIDELLYLNRIDSNRIKVSYLKTNISEFCKEIFETIKEPFQNIETSIEIKLEKPDYNIDRVIVQKILSNLLVNAFKFNINKGKVSFTIYSENDKLCFKISDTGIGIPEEEHINVFEPFSRMSNSQHIKGTGLGLSIVKKSVDQLGGSVNFSSNKNGTTFTVVIPYY